MAHPYERTVTILWRENSLHENKSFDEMLLRGATPVNALIF